MLVLSRRVGESIKIGDDITITLVGINHLQVKIGVDAPKDVPIRREEIADKMKVTLASSNPNSPGSKTTMGHKMVQYSTCTLCNGTGGDGHGEPCGVCIGAGVTRI